MIAWIGIRIIRTGIGTTIIGTVNKMSEVPKTVRHIVKTLEIVYDLSLFMMKMIILVWSVTLNIIRKLL